MNERQAAFLESARLAAGKTDKCQIKNGPQNGRLSLVSIGSTASALLATLEKSGLCRSVTMELALRFISQRVDF